MKSITSAADAMSERGSMRMSMTSGKRAPPRELAPAIIGDVSNVQRALVSAAAVRMSMTSGSRPVSMSLENRGGGAWGGLLEGNGAAGGPPTGPGAGASLFDEDGETLFGREHQGAKLLEPSHIVVDGTV